MRCEAKYAGPSFPQRHGLECILDAQHTGRHLGLTEDRHAILWWTPEEKEALRKRDEGAK